MQSETPKNQNPNIMSLATDGFYSIYKNLFSENIWVVGGSAIAALGVSLFIGSPIIFSAILTKTLIAGYLFSSLIKPYSKLSCAIPFALSDTDKYEAPFGEPYEHEHAKRALCLVILLALINPASIISNFFSTLFSLNLLQNPLVQGAVLTAALTGINKLIDIISDSVFYGMNLNNLFKLFKPKESAEVSQEKVTISGLLIPIGLGLAVIGYINLSFINPFLSITALDGAMKLLLATIIGYFPGSILYKSIEKLFEFVKNNFISIFQREQDGKYKLNPNSVIGELYDQAAGLYTTCYDAIFQNKYEKNDNKTQDSSDDSPLSPMMSCD